MEILVQLWLLITIIPPAPLDVSFDDLHCFPPPATVKLVRAAAWSQHIDARERKPIFLQRDHYSIWDDYCRATYWVWDVWDDLHRAQDVGNPPSERLFRLARLRWLIGQRSYYQGLLPPMVPLWCPPPRQVKHCPDPAGE